MVGSTQYGMSWAVSVLERNSGVAIALSIASTLAVESVYANTFSGECILESAAVRVVSVTSSHVAESMTSGRGMFPDPEVLSSHVS